MFCVGVSNIGTNVTVVVPLGKNKLKPNEL